MKSLKNNLNLKINLIFLFSILMLPWPSFAQLQLQRKEGGRKITFAPGKEIILHLSNTGAGDPCDNYILYQGILKGMEDNKAKLVLKETVRTSPADNEGMSRQEVMKFKYKGVEKETSVPLNGLMSVVKVRKQQNIAGTLMVASLLQGLVIGPLFLSGKSRKISDGAVLAGFSTSVVLFANDRKYYYLYQPQGRTVKQWRLAD